MGGGRGGVGIKMSWVGKNRKIYNRGWGRLFLTREYLCSFSRSLNMED